MTQPSTNYPQPRKPGEHLLESLKTIHNYLRHDLAVCQTLGEQVAAGAPPEHIKAQIESLQTSSPLWKLRVNCPSITVASCIPTIPLRTRWCSLHSSRSIPTLAQWWTS